MPVSTSWAPIQKFEIRSSTGTLASEQGARTAGKSSVRHLAVAEAVLHPPVQRLPRADLDIAIRADRVSPGQARRCVLLRAELHPKELATGLPHLGRRSRSGAVAAQAVEDPSDKPGKASTPTSTVASPAPTCTVSLLPNAARTDFRRRMLRNNMSATLAPGHYGRRPLRRLCNL